MATYLADDTRKVTTTQILEMKQQGKQIAMLTSYDFSTARLVDRVGVDIVLIGDSAGNVMAGNQTTIPVTLDEMIYHGRCVSRAVRRALVVCDMPFGTYHASVEDAVRNAVRLFQQSGVDALKLEGGERVIPAIRAIINTGIPVMGHLGLTPQSVHVFGGFGLRADTKEEADRLIREAHMLEEAGCFAIVLEKIPAYLTAGLRQKIRVPLIGIGAGLADGQVLVVNDLLGYDHSFSPKFVRRYADFETLITDAVAHYVSDVKDELFPSDSEWY